MNDLGEVLGTLMSSLVHARRIADAELAAVAEHYRQDPLLEGLSMPRVRVPELVLELPLVIQGHDAGEEGEEEDPSKVTTALVATAKKAAADGGFELPDKFTDFLKKELVDELKGSGGAGRVLGGRRIVSRETTVRAADRALGAVWAKNQVFADAVDAQKRKALADALRKTAREKAVKKESVSPSIRTSILTSDVKTGADPESVTRVRIRLREEGVEWETVDHEDGTKTRRLGPE